MSGNYARNYGTYTLSIVGRGSYEGSRQVAYAVSRRSATVAANNATKTEGEFDPKPTATISGVVAGDSLSYSLGRQSGETPGMYTITASGSATQGNYNVTFRNATLTIKPKASSERQISQTVVATVPDQTYTGTDIKPKPVVKYGDKTLVENEDYTYEWSQNTKTGTATITIRGKQGSGYTGTKSVTFKIKPASITSASVSPSSYKYDGKAKKPAVTVKAGNVTVPASEYDVTYANNVNAGTATVTVKGKGNYTGTVTASFKIEKPMVNATSLVPAAHVVYRTHVQTYGWQGWRRDGQMSGTSGQAKRLEGINIRLEGQPYPGGIEYRTHVQTYGWQGWRRDGQMSGTSGQAKRLEAIEIRLTGQMAQRYDVYYRVHAQTYGWMGWAKNGARAGTATMAKRLEGIQVVLVPKGAAAPGATYGGIAQRTGAAYATRQVAYRTHVQTFGWQDWRYDGAASGTSGQPKRLEGINIRLADPLYPGSIEYRTHVQTYGWQPYRRDGAMSGTSGQAKRLEAIQIRLTGQMAAHYDVWYRVHAQTFGWMGWARNDQQAGTAGYAKRLEAIQIRILPKGSAAPGPTANAFRQKVAVTGTYDAVYGPIINNLRQEAARHDDRSTTKYKYFLFDIDGNGVKELIAGNTGPGSSFGGVYTIVKRGSALSAAKIGELDIGFRSTLYGNGGRLHISHVSPAGGYTKPHTYTLVSIRNGRIAYSTVAEWGLRENPPIALGSQLPSYNIYTHISTSRNYTVDQSGLTRAGRVSIG